MRKLVNVSDTTREHERRETLTLKQVSTGFKSWRQLVEHRVNWCADAALWYSGQKPYVY